MRMRKIKSNESNNHKVNKKRVRIVILVIGVFLLGFILSGLYGVSQIRPIKAQASGLKADVRTVVAYVAQRDLVAARSASDQMRVDSSELREAISTPYWKIISSLPIVGKQLKSAVKLTEILDTTNNEIIVPMIDLMEEHPADTVIASGTINTDAVIAYVEYFEKITLVMNDLSVEMQDIDVSMVDSDGKIMAYLNGFIQLTDVMNEASGRVLMPAVDMLRRYPIDSIKTEAGYDNEALRSYLIFIDNVLPEVEYMASYIENKDFGTLDPNGKVREYTTEVVVFVGFLDDTSKKVIRPLIDQLEQTPLDYIKADGGFNVIVINEYLTFMEGVMPDFREISAEMDGLEVSHLNSNGKISEYQEKLNHIIDTYDKGEKYLPLIHSILGDGSDRFYFLGTQGTSEIRASGGFPGTVGSLCIENGLLYIGDFHPIHDDFFHFYMPPSANITAEERELFYGMPYPWDADFCPDFERVGEIWALSYEECKNKKVDGVISLTPSIIQELLKFLGDVELSDGTVLTGENATQFLNFEIYAKYQSANSGGDYDSRNDYVDGLFAETAKKTMSLLVDEFKVAYMPEFLGVLSDGIESRNIMFWFADETEQQIAIDTDSSGGLNRDAENPQAGVYFSLCNACKMGWFVDIITECGNPVINEDGSRTYDIIVTFANTLTVQDAPKYYGYITFGSGYINCLIHLFAPAGGTVSDFATSNGVKVIYKSYKGLDLGYINCGLNPGCSMTVTYKVTTAPGVETPLAFSVTPNMTEYRY